MTIVMMIQKVQMRMMDNDWRQNVRKYVRWLDSEVVLNEELLCSCQKPNGCYNLFLDD